MQDTSTHDKAYIYNTISIFIKYKNKTKLISFQFQAKVIPLDRNTVL